MKFVPDGEGILSLHKQQGNSFNMTLTSGPKEGVATRIWLNGNIFVREFKNGILNGKGVLTKPLSFEGTFVNG